MSRKKQYPGGVKLTAKTARTLAMQEFGTARGLTKSTSFVGVYFMEFGNLRIEICAFCGEMNNHFGSGGSVNIWTVGAIERRECTKCRKQFHKISLTVPPDETPEAFYLRVIKAVTA